jgi:hypothetical protein
MKWISYESWTNQLSHRHGSRDMFPCGEAHMYPSAYSYSGVRPRPLVTSDTHQTYITLMIHEWRENVWTGLTARGRPAQRVTLMHILYDARWDRTQATAVRLIPWAVARSKQSTCPRMRGAALHCKCYVWGCHWMVKYVSGRYCKRHSRRCL